MDADKRPVEQLVPGADRRQDEINRAIAGIRAQRQRTGKITVDDLLSARDERRR